MGLLNKWANAKMTAKLKPSRLASEIEKCRQEENWSKAIELAQQLLHISSKAPGLDLLSNFIIGESKLEEYLTSQAADEKSAPKSKSQLSEAEAQLTGIAQTENRFKFQAQLLLAKLSYTRGAYQSVLSIYDTIGLDDVSINSNAPRYLRLIAEAYAIKGLCLEKLPPPTTSKFKAVERETKIMAYLEKAGDAAILYLQEKEKMGNAVTNIALASMSSWLQNMEEKPGPILETAIQRSPIFYIKNGDLVKGIGRFREMLSAIECRFTSGLRQVLSRQLAEVLLRGVCTKTYCPYDVINQTGTSNNEKNTKPHRYSGESRFFPKDENEEALLLLLISEAIATRDTVLNRSREHSEARLHTFHTTAAVYDLLAIALVKRTQFNLLAESFERAMRFSFDEFHIWFQFALSLICAGKYMRAMLVLKECATMQPQNPKVLLQAAKICYENLYLLDEGITFSERAVDIHIDHCLSARVHMSLGIGYSLKANEQRLQGDRHVFQKRALDSFYSAYSIDSNDYLTAFHLALQLGSLRQLNEAIRLVKHALKLQSDHVHSLHLLILLLSANKQLQEAISLVQATLQEYPDNLGFLLTKSKLEEVCYGPEAALTTCRNMLELWKEFHEIEEDDCSMSYKRSGPMDRMPMDKRSVAQLQLTELSERDSASPGGSSGYLTLPKARLLSTSGSIRAESIAASRVEHTLSELASSIDSSFQSRRGPQKSWLLQAQIWLYLAELYLSSNKVAEAEACVQETSLIFPLSHQVSYMRGRVYEFKQELTEAKACYENAISVNPGHIKSLQHLGLVLHHLENDRMAEKVLREAVNSDPTSHQSWYRLGQVLKSLGEHAAASECQLTATELELTSPVVPFSVIPKVMQ